MKNFKKGFISETLLVLLGVSLLVASVTTYLNIKSNNSFYAGSYNPTGGGTYRLQSSIGTSNTSITLSSFKEPVSNIPYTMSYLNSSIEYATIDPQTAYKEFISFTGITQNADGTATLTGVSRGLGFSYPYTASSTLAQSHSGQSILILSNPPQLTNMYANKSNDEAITAIWSFNSYLPTSSIVATSSNQFVTKSLLDATSFQGTATSTESLGGIVELSTQLEMASSTYSATAPAVLYSRYATSSPYTTGLWIPITQNDGKLSQSFIRLSDAFNWTGAHNWTSSAVFNATTSISASSVLSNAFKLNTVPYSFPSTRAASSTVLTEDGAGGLTWLLPQSRVLYLSNVRVQSADTATTTIVTVVIPANTLTTRSQIRIRVSPAYTNDGGGQVSGFGYALGNGSASTTIAYRQQSNAINENVFTTNIIATSTTAQKSQTALITSLSSTDFLTAATKFDWMRYSGFDTTTQLYLSFDYKSNTSGATMNLEGLMVEILTQ